MTIRFTPLRGGAVRVVTAAMAVAAAATILTPLAPSAAAAPGALPQALDLSHHKVDITTGFTGTDLLLFGTMPQSGNVIVVIRGPSHTETVRRKAREIGIWVNTGRAEINGAPSFYQVAATAKPSAILPKATLDAHQIGVQTLKMTVGDTDKGATTAQYRAAMIRLKQRIGLYDTKVQPITQIDHRLFKTEIHFPANVPTGTYQVKAYFVDNNAIVGTGTTPLTVAKVGFVASVYAFAQKQAALYGIVAILLAAAAGWLAAAAFKKK